MAKKANEPEVTADGIKVSLGGPYWVLYRKEGWTFSDEMKFQDPKLSNLDAFRLIVERAVDWNFPDADWKPQPFDKAKLLAGFDMAKRGEVTEDELFAAVNLVLLGYKANSDELDTSMERLDELFQRLQSTRIASGIPSFPIQLERPLILSWWQALTTAKKLPLPSNSAATAVP